jgi:hypothetical protein
MTSEPSKDTTTAPDASDVVTGPVGSASLRDPATSGPEGAQLDQLPDIEVPSAGVEPALVDGEATQPARP